MLARTAVAVSACADLVVEGAVDFVLLRAEDGGEVVGHGFRCASISSPWVSCGYARSTGD